MAIIDADKIDGFPGKDTGLRIDPKEVDLKVSKNDKEKAILVMEQPGAPVKQKRHNQGWWPEEKKVEACTLYAALGSPKRVAALTKVPEKTIARWMTEDWWFQVMSKVRREENHQTDAKFSKIVDKALDSLMDRIQHGDAIYDIKRGKVVDVPVSGRDLAIITGTIFDKRQLLRGEATKIVSASTSEEHLKALAMKFESYVKSREKQVVAIQENTNEEFKADDNAGDTSNEGPDTPTGNVV